ncbi:hypothetical protein F5Y12DRAFT_236007 [Xylaria sp. FL1777]|nr:hypothetical protein F5Y12DRAFT_236007 [Xylaria sp. FL1777]
MKGRLAGFLEAFDPANCVSVARVNLPLWGEFLQHTKNADAGHSIWLLLLQKTLSGISVLVLSTKILEIPTVNVWLGRNSDPTDPPEQLAADPAPCGFVKPDR